jgi:hypothetical protein
MIMGKSYDFRKQQAKSASSPLAQISSPPQVLGDQTQPLAVSLTSPVDGLALAFNKPLFQGTGVAGKEVRLVISANSTLSESITVRQDGTWQYTPTRPLREGAHTVSMSTVDGQNKPIKLSHTFTILKSGSQVLGDATPSATLSPTVDISPTTSITATPTQFASPTATLIPTPTPTVDLIGKPVPVSGNGPGTLGYIVIGGGLLLLFFGLAF